MGMVVRTNTMAQNAYRQLGVNNTAVGKSLEKLSSGFRINRAADDASGLAISEKMKAQIKGLEQASANSQDGISLIQTAEGATTEIHNMLNRMTELATKSANGTIQDPVDREAIQQEVDDLNKEITRIAESTNFNGINLLDGSMGMNKAAFAFGGKVSDAVRGALQDLTGALANEHLGAQLTTQKVPSFNVDLGDLTVTGAKKDDTMAFEIAGTTITYTFTQADQDAGGNFTTAQMRDKLIAEFNTEETGAGAATAGEITGSGMYFKAVADGATGIKFSFAGMTANTTGALATDKFTATEATTANGKISAEFKADATLDAGAATGAVLHDNFNVINASAADNAARAGIDFTMTAAMITDGNKLTIDGKTFVFKNTANGGVTAGDGETLIDVSGFSTNDEKLQQAIDKMSSYESTNFKIEAKSGTVLHIDQKVGNSKLYDSAEILKKQFTLESKGIGAKTSFNITNNSKITEGNSVNIDGKKYTFGSKAGQIAIGADAEATLNNLKDALKDDGYNAVTTSDGKIVIEAKAGGADAPVVQGNGLTLQIGDTADAFNKVTVAVDDLSANGIGTAGLNVSGQDAAADAIQTINDAINQVSTNRANLGSLQNRLEYTINNLDTTAENMTAANSRIRDTDMAKEMMNYTKMNILTQSAQAMLAQANQQPQAILQLLQ